MQPGDFTSSYHHQYPHTTPANPSPHSISYPPAPSPTAASAPFYSDTSYGSTPELSSAYHYTHPPFPHNSDPVPSLSSPISTPSYPPVPANHFPPQVTQYFPPSTPSSTQVPESTGLYPSAQQSPAPPPTHYFPYDPSPQTAPPSMTSTLSTSYPNPNPNSTSLYPSNFNSPGSSGTSLYDAIRKFDHGSGYLDENSGGYNGYGRSRSELGADGYVNRRTESGGSRDRFGPGMYGDEGYRDGGAYAYQGKTEPYGARGGTKPKSSTMFDDYGRPISSAPSLDRERSSSLKVVRAIPKAEAQSDSKNGVQKFRVKLLAESGGQNTMDVLCQVGLDGIRMLDPNTSRTLRIYPLENVSRCEKFDSSTIAFWSKTSVDFEARRIRLQSNSYTTSTLLDTITAATVQFKEMGGRFKPPEPSKVAEQPTDKKKGLTDWVTRLKPTFSSYEEKDHWVPDEAVSKCTACGTDFSAFVRRHHCRNCGDVFCDKCTHGRIALTADENAQPVRVCDRCMAEVTRRLSSARESAGRSAVVHSHEDLAKKLQDEMERNRRVSSSSGSKFDGSGRRMKEVACPTCTVHLQVQVPSSGSETIECGVCQHPFLVSSH